MSKTKTYKSEKNLKNSQKLVLNFDRLLKNALHGNYQKIYKFRNVGGGLFGITVVNYRSLLSNFFPLAPQIISFFKKYRRNRLLLQSFIELPVLYFTIYQLVNKRTEILAIAISHMAHICN